MFGKNDKYPFAVVLGDLNLVRSLGLAKIPVIVMSPIPENPARHSRYCFQYIETADPFSYPDKVVEDLIKLGKKLDKKAVLFYNGDYDLLTVSRNREVLSNYFHFLMGEKDLVESLVDKKKFLMLALTKELPVPMTWIIKCEEDLKKIKPEIEFPCAVKPLIQRQWLWKENVHSLLGGPGKSIRLNNIDDLRSFYKKIKEITGEIIVQKWVEGKDSEIYSFHAYYNANSVPVAYYVGRKVRTYPPNNGLSTYIELVKEPRVVQLGLETLDKIKIKGIVKIDIKRNVKEDKFYILEINPRFNLWNYLGACCGINLLSIAYNDILGEKIDSTFDYKTNIRWLWLDGDISALRAYRKSGDLSIPVWLFSLLKRKKIYPTFAWNDPKPFLFHTLPDISKRAMKKFYQIL